MLKEMFDYEPETDCTDADYTLKEDPAWGIQVARGRYIMYRLGDNCACLYDLGDATTLKSAMQQLVTLWCHQGQRSSVKDTMQRLAAP
jgi:hypothetical protein